MNPPPLLGTYCPPRVRVGQVVTCLYRDADCVVTGVHGGPIPWPRVRARERRGGSGLWVNETLLRAIRTESATALMHWFGVSAKVVWKWRRSFVSGAGKFRTPGSAAAHQQASAAGAEAMRERGVTAAERAGRRRAARRQGRTYPDRWRDAGWTAAEHALLGTDHDEAIARRLGRTRSAVTTRRVRAGIPAFSEWPGGGRRWTSEEDARLGTAPDAAVARQLGRTRSAVSQRRALLNVPPHRVRRRKR